MPLDTLLVVMGRGIQQTAPGQWDLTEDLEIVENDRGAHLPMRVPANDNDPLCLIGGGRLNLVAGFELYKKLDPKLITLAYGDRHPYLRDLGAPSENQVMTDYFLKLARVSGYTPPVVPWTLTPTEVRPNSKREFQNSLEVAAGAGIGEVTVVTVVVHAWRLSLFIQELKQEHPEFRNLKIKLVTSEEVLLDVDAGAFGSRIRRMHESQAFMRTIRTEGFGINHVLNGTYQ